MNQNHAPDCTFQRIGNLDPCSCQKLLGLSQAEFEQLKQAANRTWQGIGMDCAEANGGEPFERAEVIELALDADRMRQYGPHVRRGEKDTWPETYDTRIRPWLTKHYGSAEFFKLMEQGVSVQTLRIKGTCG